MKTIDHVAEADAIAGWKNGDRAAGARLLAMHDGLVRVTVRQYVNARCELADLLQTGRMAVLRAAATDGFDPTKASFMSYAMRAVVYAVQRYRDAVTSDLTAGDKTHRCVAALRALDHIGANAEDLGVTAPDKHDLIERNRAAVSGLMLRAARLDAPVAPGANVSLVDTIHNGQVPADEQLESHMERERLDSMMSTLEPIARNVLTRRYLADEPETLTEIADTWCVSRERIRQVEAAAIAQLRRQAKKIARPRH